jgi:hypothetical protein
MDVTIPDNTRLNPEQAFVKTWRLRNTGACPWNTDDALVFVSGDRLGAPLTVNLPGAVVPGATVDISVPMRAPSQSGVYRGAWLLQTAEGVRFGTGATASNEIWVRIVVGQPPSTATPTPAITSWRGEYYNNRDLSGAPILIRNDSAIDFNWGTGSPAGTIAVDSFSARWTRTLDFPTGTYRFYVKSDDGVRVWLDNVLIIDQWHEAANAAYASERTMIAGPHILQVAYYENRGNAAIQFWWERVGDYPDWRGEYFSNPNLAGSPLLTRNDTRIDFNWGTHAPAYRVPADNFSVRWTRTLNFTGGTYRFRVIVDDGARLIIDGNRVIDTWKQGARREVTVDVPLSSGYHTIRVEYFEAGGDASIQVHWDQDVTYPNWKGQYWANAKLDGSPVLVRNDKEVRFNWETGSPDAVVPRDNFSARWRRTLTLQDGIYRISARADDGVRVRFDDVLVLSEWHSSSGNTTYTKDITVLQGDHTFIVEYYEGDGSAWVKVWVDRVSALPTPTATPKPPTPTPKPPTPTPTPTVPPTGTPTPTPTPTLPPTETPTPTPTPTLPPTETPTPTPTEPPTVTPAPNRPPTAVDDEVTTLQSVPVGFNVLDNDTDPDGDPLILSDYDATGLLGGTVLCVEEGDCVYSPLADFLGKDTFTYTVSDEVTGSSTGVVVIDVIPYSTLKTRYR